MTTKHKIESPISAFNNIMFSISKQIHQIYFDVKADSDEEFLNNLIFGNDSILIFGKIKLQYLVNEEKTSLKFLGEFNSLNDFSLITKTMENLTKLKEILTYYIFTLSPLTKIDPTINLKTIEIICSNYDKNIKIPLHIIPLGNKIDLTKDKSLENIVNRYSYLLEIIPNGKTTFKYKIIGVLSSLFNESKNIENLRYEELEILNTDILNNKYLSNFLIDIFFYGTIKTY